MKYRLSIGMLVVCVSMLVCMSNALATIGPGAWINQATLSTIDYTPGEDPESSGFGTIQVVVWEEWITPNNCDIYMKYSLLDGALGTWVFPAVHPATNPDAIEINPAVTVTNADITGAIQVHVVYESNAGPAAWNIWHTYTLNMGNNWIVPAGGSLNTNEAHDPAIVYSEEVSNPVPPDVWYSMAVQIVWSEFNPAPAGPNLFEIYYNAWYFDGSVNPPAAWAYAVVPPASFTVQASAGGHCEKPEIAAIDETMTVGTWEFYFAIVWQEPSIVAPFNTEIWYVDGWLTIGPGPIAFTMPVGALGQLNTNPPGSGNCIDPDIAATQDYQNPAVGLEEFYIHVNWLWQIAGPPAGFQIDTCYFSSPVPTPGAGVFIATASPSGAALTALDRPTIAAKLIARIPWQGMTIFETWMCWEDTSVPGSSPDIWYRVGQHTVGGAPFGFIVPAAIVPYVQPIGGASEYNPELWNRNDASRLFPPFTHLVFDMTSGLGGNQEVEYIDP